MWEWIFSLDVLVFSFFFNLLFPASLEGSMFLVLRGVLSRCCFVSPIVDRCVLIFVADLEREWRLCFEWEAELEWWRSAGELGKGFLLLSFLIGFLWFWEGLVVSGSLCRKKSKVWLQLWVFSLSYSLSSTFFLFFSGVFMSLFGESWLFFFFFLTILSVFVFLPHYSVRGCLFLRLMTSISLALWN